MAGTTRSMPNLPRRRALALPATAANNQAFNQRAGRHLESVVHPARDQFESACARKMPNKQSNLPACPPAYQTVGSSADGRAITEDGR